jgi:hypothetical protein
MTLEINLHELNTPFECCILEPERIELRGNSLKFWNRKCIKWGEKIVLSSNLLLFRREIFLRGDVLQGQRVILIKWDNSGDFLF